jgi:hypothetical protein
MFLATAAVLSLGIGTAFAGESDGANPNTFFTELPGVLAQSPAQQSPSAFARNQSTGKPTSAFVTTSRGSGTWLFAPNPNQGGNS